uniref:Uncharacterized protein n=1 Tax=Dulem virus 35 TaxID=3145753 RepID=A0AAU8B143_9CAUD
MHASLIEIATHPGREVEKRMQFPARALPWCRFMRLNPLPLTGG